MKRRAFLALLSLALAAPVSADDEDGPPARAFTHSFGASPFAILGEVYGNYEFLAAQRHGLVAEGGYAVFGISQGTWGLGAGYRYHFSPHMESAFVGAFARTGAFKGEFIGEDEERFEYESPITVIGVNAGRKYLWNSGFTLAWRIGYGFPFVDIEWSPTRPKPGWIAGLTSGLAGLDAEFSLGFSL